MTITEFLLPRIAEDEQMVPAAAVCTCREGQRPNGRGDGHYPSCVEHVRPDCEAKRRIVELHTGTHECVGAGPGGWSSVADDESPCPTLLALASVYADRPDFREEWRL